MIEKTFLVFFLYFFLIFIWGGGGGDVADPLRFGVGRHRGNK